MTTATMAPPEPRPWVLPFEHAGETCVSCGQARAAFLVVFPPRTDEDLFAVCSNCAEVIA